MTQTLIERLEDLPRYEVQAVESSCGAYTSFDEYEVGEWIKYSDLRAIIEQAKREAVEPIAGPVAWCWYNKHSGAFVLGNYEPEYDTFPDAAIDIEPLYTAPQPYHTKLIGELVEALEKLENWAHLWTDESNGMLINTRALITKAREAIK